MSTEAKGITRLSLDIDQGWPVAKPDPKGPLVFYLEHHAALAASSARVEKLEAALTRLLGDALDTQERDDAAVNYHLSEGIEIARSALKGE